VHMYNGNIGLPLGRTFSRRAEVSLAQVEISSSAANISVSPENQIHNDKMLINSQC
jgi:hypothetical protein